MISFIIISGLMVTSPTWVLLYDRLTGKGKTEPNNAEQDWWF